MNIAAAGASYDYGTGIGFYIFDTARFGSSKRQDCKIAIGGNNSLGAIAVKRLL